LAKPRCLLKADAGDRLGPALDVSDGHDVKDVRGPPEESWLRARGG
jgi:hypothetical protein